MKTETWGVTASASKDGYIRYNPKQSYSKYALEIEYIGFLLRCVERYVKRTQRNFHYEEGKYHHALIMQLINDDVSCISEEEIHRLQQEKDYRMERFCAAHKLKLFLIAEREKTIYANEIGKRKLHGYRGPTMQ